MGKGISCFGAASWILTSSSSKISTLLGRVVKLHASLARFHYGIKSLTIAFVKLLLKIEIKAVYVVSKIEKIALK